MPELVYSLQGDAVAHVLDRLQQPAAPLQGPEGAGFAPRIITGRWRNHAGDASGESFPVNVSPPDFVEYPGQGGEYTSAEKPAALSFAAEAPPGAAQLEIAIDGIEAAQIPVTALAGGASHLPPPRSQRVGPADASLVVPVFSERFTDEQRFFDAVIQLRAWIVTQPPFDEAAIGGKLGFDAHYWPSDPVAGLFGTYDANIKDGRLLYGDQALARRLLAPWTGNGVSLILIDSPLRGGAGGSPGYSAWTSITGAPGEHWEAVGLHEIGHGLGLADEYVDAVRAGQRPDVLEPNISRDPLPSRAPWSAIRTVSDAPAPTGGLHYAAVAKGTVGTFQGARYRTDLYRPSDTCLMKETGAGFCAVCIAHIRSNLGG